MSRHEIAAGTAGKDRYGMDGDADGMFSHAELQAHYKYKASVEAERRAQYAAQAAHLQAMANKNKTIYETVPGFAARRGFNGNKMETFKYGKVLSPAEFADRDTPGTSPDVILPQNAFAKMMSRPGRWNDKPQLMPPRSKWRSGPNVHGGYSVGTVGVYDPTPHRDAVNYVEREWNTNPMAA